MHSLPESLTSVGRAAAACKPAAALGTIENALQICDGLLISAGLLLAIVALWRWRTRSLAAPRDAHAQDGPTVFPIEVVFLPVMAYLGATLGAYPLLAALVGKVEPADTTNDAFDLAALLTNTLALLCGGLVCWAAGRRVFLRRGEAFVLRRGRFWRDAALGGAGAIVAIALCQLTLYLTVRAILQFAPDAEFPQHGVIDALRSPACPAWLPVLLWLGVIIVTPFAEELFFRGILQTALARTLRSSWTAIVVTGLVFGFAHSGQPQVVPALTLFGVILGILYARTGALVAPIVAHALFNGKTLLWESLRMGA